MDKRIKHEPNANPDTGINTKTPYKAACDTLAA